MDESAQLQVFRDLGSMDARIGGIENTVTGIQADVKILLARDAQQKGGKTTMASIGVGGVSVGGLLVAAAQWLGIGVHDSPTQQYPPAITQPAPRDADRRVNESTGP